MSLQSGKMIVSVTWSVLSAGAAAYFQMSEIEMLSEGTVQERPSRFCFLKCLLVFCGLSDTECLSSAFSRGGLSNSCLTRESGSSLRFSGHLLPNNKA